MIVRFVIPNRDDPEQTPTLYEEWGCEAVPREGESVFLRGTPWRIKSVTHAFELASVPRIDVRLIEPDRL